MNPAVSQSILVSRAVEFIQEKILEKGGCSQAHIEEAAMRFNLSPKEALTLERVFREEIRQFASR